jgi:hypothetical protein
MPLWQWVADAVGAALLLVLLYALALVVRRRAIQRHGGTFELSHRARSAPTGRGWVLGVGRYSGETLEWFRIFSLSPRPKRAWPRESLTFRGRREPESNEQLSLYADHVIVTCSSERGDIDLAMSPSSLVGFQSWLEAAPPGQGAAR